MEEREIYSKLRDVFVDVFDDDSIALSPETTASDVDGWDSLTHVRLLMTIQKSFKIKFTTSEIGKLQNVGDLARRIQERAT
jgi:acyl carrier protein